MKSAIARFTPPMAVSDLCSKDAEEGPVRGGNFYMFIPSYTMRVLCWSSLFLLVDVAWSARVPRLSNLQPECGEDQFTCREKFQCLRISYVCDGTADCIDGSDETELVCKSNNSSVRCPPLSFTCDYGACIPKERSCDQKVDCVDGSDEAEKNGCHKSPSEEPRTFFRCDDGDMCANGDCIETADVCNGRRDCEDGSDETANRCSGIRCGRTLFQCDYGACIAPKLVCDGKNDCDDGSDEENCSVKEELSPDLAVRFPEVKLCPPLKSDSMDFTCKDGDAEVDCSLWSTPGAQSTQKCKKYFEPQSTLYPATANSKCLETGEWESTHLKCVLECGKIRVQVPDNYTSKVAYGDDAKEGQFPWYAALYLINATKPESANFKCGGSIISPNLIITAAHCIMPDERLKFKPVNLTVVVGKFNSSWEIKNPTEQRCKVKKIAIGKKFNHRENNYEQDIAVMELLDRISFNDVVQPVCIDWKKEGTSFPPKLLGSVAGFGSTEKAKISPTLQYAKIPYNSYETCSNLDVIAHDKFCAGHIKKTGGEAHVLTGDSGGGFTLEGNNNITYLYGVVSNRPNQFNGGYTALYTNVTQYLGWLEDAGYADMLS